MEKRVSKPSKSQNTIKPLDSSRYAIKKEITLYNNNQFASSNATQNSSTKNLISNNKTSAATGQLKKICKSQNCSTSSLFQSPQTSMDMQQILQQILKNKKLTPKMERRISNRSNNNHNTSKVASHSPMQSNCSINHNNNHIEKQVQKIKKTDKQNGTKIQLKDFLNETQENDLNQFNQPTALQSKTSKSKDFVNMVEQRVLRQKQTNILQKVEQIQRQFTKRISKSPMQTKKFQNSQAELTRKSTQLSKISMGSTHLNLRNHSPITKKSNDSQQQSINSMYETFNIKQLNFK